MNCIICAPTGSGKTIVALYIAWQHLQDKESKEMSEEQDCIHKRGKVLFVVDRIHLTSQHQKKFQTYLPKKYRIAKIASDSSDKLQILLDNYDVTVSTAQIVVDALKEGRVKLSEISLLIIDECHHTNREHPYNQIMSHYLNVKLQPSTSAVSTSLELPQVVGLSASVGVGKSRNVSAATEHIIYICSTMDAQKLTTVERNKKELQRYSSSPEVTLHKVTKTNYKFEGAVNDAMNEIEEKVMKYNVPGDNRGNNDRAQQRYRNWIENAFRAAFTNHFLMTYLEHLRKYHIALTIAEVSQMSSALSYLEDYFEQQDEKKFMNIDQTLKKIFEKMRQQIKDYIKENGEPSNPKLEKIKKLLLDCYAKDGNSRGILFTKTRESTVALASWIEKTEELRDKIKAARIVGTGGGEASQTAAEQDQVIREFHKGDVNLLIATTVAEEGLDIAECSYVIRLDMSGNEISTAQARGRVRTKQGKYDYIGDTSSGLVEKEELNILKEILMMKAVDCVQKMDYGDFLTKVKANQLKQIEQRATKLQKRKLSQSQCRPEDVTFLCKKCGIQACRADDFRRLCETYYVVVSQDIMGIVTTKARDKPEQIGEVQMNEKVYCGKCGYDWGVMATLEGISRPCLKIKSFVLIKSDGTKKTIKKWSKCPFEVPPL